MYTTLILTPERLGADASNRIRQGKGRDATTTCKEVITNIDYARHYRPFPPFSLVSLTPTLLLNYQLATIVIFT